MKIIKLDAIDSTNDFLKNLSNQNETLNFTIVTAETQTKGKGQMGSKWISESGKNLIVSILEKEVLQNINQIFDLNVVVAVSILQAIETFKIKNLSIKWPNDIMAGNKKIGGILIENVIKPNNIIYSIIGFGLNVNQTNFDDLPNASSLKNIANKTFEKELILIKIVEFLEKNINILKNNQQNQLWELYNKLLYKKDKIMAFEDQNNEKFMGIIQKVTPSGKLVLLKETDILQEYDVKEIKMLY